MRKESAEVSGVLFVAAKEQQESGGNEWVKDWTENRVKATTPSPFVIKIHPTSMTDL